MHLLPQMNVMLDFICTGSVELRGTRSKRKFSEGKLLVHSGTGTRNPLIMRPTSNTIDLPPLVENVDLKVKCHGYLY